jgi:hypothetical protein
MSWKGLAIKYFCLAILVILQLTLPWKTGMAQMASPAPLTSAVPEEWREPYIQFLASLDLTDTTAIVASTKFKLLTTSWRPNSAIFRIESGCSGDMCPTMIAHLSEGRLVADAQFLAGPNMTHFDSTHGLSFPLLFVGSTARIEVIENRAGWFVAVETATPPDHGVTTDK